MTLTILVQFLHVLLGIFWFGSVLYADFILIPAISGFPVEKQIEIGGRVGVQSDRIIPPVAVAVIVLGFLRGTVWGAIHSVSDVFASAYGVTWFVSLLLGIGILVYGFTLTGPTAKSLASATSDAEFTARLGRIKLLAQIELLGFIAIFVCMILMRFGL